MEIRRTILWMIFLVSLFFLWDAWQVHTGAPSILSSNTASTQANASTTTDSAVPSGVSNTNSTTNISDASIHNNTSVSSETVTLSSDVLTLTFDTIGGRLVEAVLLNHGDLANAQVPLRLLNPEQNYSVDIGLTGGGSDQLAFANHQTKFVVTNQGTHQNGQHFITLRGEHNGLAQETTYTLTPGSYAVGVSTSITNTSETPLQPSLYFLVTRDKSVPPGDTYFYSTFSGPVVYSEAEKYQKLKFADIEKGSATFIANSSNGWFGFVQHYFATVWVPPTELERKYSFRRVNDNLFSMSATSSLGEIAAGTTKTIASTLWIGPQDQKAMLAIADGLDVVVDYGWLKIIAKPLFILMTWIHSIVNNWGWTIVILTVLIKLVFFPLSAASYKSMARMKALAPRLTALREQYADDKMKLNQAMMEMYRTEKINPLGGCLPMLVQIPVFISLYWVLLGSVEMRGAPWILWITDLSVQDPFFILPALMMGTMFLQMRLNPKPPDPMQAKVMMFMPLVFGGMMFFFPAGLVLYWVVNNTLSIAQQWIITRKLESK